MGRKQSPAEFKKALKARVKVLREAAGLSQEGIAKQLGVQKDTYAKWENRANSVIPMDKVPAFLKATGGNYEYLFEGRSPRIASPGDASKHVA